MTLEQILQRIGGYVDQDVATPTDSDLDIRVNFVNEAYEEWAQSYDWPELTTTYGFMPTAASTATVALPVNFMKFQSKMRIFQDGTAFEYEQIKKGETFSPTDEVFYVDGSRVGGYVALVPKGLSSGASVSMEIQSLPSSLATLPDTTIIPDENFLVQRGVMKVWLGRGDGRFTEMEAKGTQSLANMIENRNVAMASSGQNRARDYYKKVGYKIGRR